MNIFRTNFPEDVMLSFGGWTYRRYPVLYIFNENGSAFRIQVWWNQYPQIIISLKFLFLLFPATILFPSPQMFHIWSPMGSHVII
jgi:hypothetical protein